MKTPINMKTPKHIAIIMDGNARWAKSKGLPKFKGHQKGSEIIENIVKKADAMGVKIITFYAFSTENWNRKQTEIDFLLDLLCKYLKSSIIKRMIKNNVKLNFIGDISAFSNKLQKEIINVKEKTKNNTGIITNIALNYGGRDEIVNAVNKIIKSGKKNITKKAFAKYLYTHDTPDPDLLIRTSGELRISNFLLWQIAYSEIYVTKKYWPDFNENDLEKAIKEYQKRERRYGGRNDKFSS